MLSYIILLALLALLLVIWMVLLVKLITVLRLFKRRMNMTSPSALEDLPTVSVCIPARNETHAMNDCLEKVIASNYPKLEIIVIDDHSHDDTPVLIKSFAHEGVRFVQADELPEGWLGKNHSLNMLADEASGSVILFLDVDTRIESNTIEELVAYMTHENADMVSVLPRRDDGWRGSVLFSTLRYFWELVFHNKTSPSSSSNFWMIKKASLDSLGGLSNYKSSIQPEAEIAANLAVHGRYRFLISTHALGVGYEKKWRSQLSTSIRLLYPLAGSNAFKAFLGLTVLVSLSIPFILCLKGFVYGWGTEQWISLAVIFLYQITYGVYTFHVWKKGWLIGAVIWPIIVIQEIILMIVSTERYIRGAVTWRGRPIAIKTKR